MPVAPCTLRAAQTQCLGSSVAAWWRHQSASRTWRRTCLVPEKSSGWWSAPAVHMEHNHSSQPLYPYTQHSTHCTLIHSTPHTVPLYTALHTLYPYTQHSTQCTLIHSTPHTVPLYTALHTLYPYTQHSTQCTLIHSTPHTVPLYTALHTLYPYTQHSTHCTLILSTDAQKHTTHAMPARLLGLLGDYLDTHFIMCIVISYIHTYIHTYYMDVGLPYFIDHMPHWDDVHVILQ